MFVAGVVAVELDVADVELGVEYVAVDDAVVGDAVVVDVPELVFVNEFVVEFEYAEFVELDNVEFVAGKDVEFDGVAPVVVVDAPVEFVEDECEFVANVFVVE